MLNGPRHVLSNVAGASTMRRVGYFGWKRDTPDARDHLYSAPLSTLRALPPSIDLSGFADPYDQGPIGSCTANAIAAAIEFDRIKQNLNPRFTPSRLFIYYNERAIEGSVAYDAGAQIRDGIKSIASQGAPPESEWPYDPVPAEYDGGPFPAGSAPATRPNAKAYADGLQHRAVQYQRVSQLVAQLKGCLAAGYPFVFGFSVYSSLYDASGNPKKVLPMPSNHDQLLGGHATLCVGYNDHTAMFKIRNSWGKAVQEQGHFEMPYAFLTDPQYASDFWTVRLISA